MIMMITTLIVFTVDLVNLITDGTKKKPLNLMHPTDSEKILLEIGNVRIKWILMLLRNSRSVIKNLEPLTVKSMIVKDFVLNVTVTTGSTGKVPLQKMDHLMENGFVLKTNSELETAINTMKAKTVCNVNGTKVTLKWINFMLRLNSLWIMV